MKGKLPDPSGPDWFARNIKHAAALIGITVAAGLVFPESAVVAAAGVAGRVVGGVTGAVDLGETLASLAGMATVKRAYEVEARRRAYRQSV